MIVGPLFVVRVVQHPSDAPGFDFRLAGSVFSRSSAHDQLDRARMSPQGFGFGPLLQLGPRLLSIQCHGRSIYGGIPQRS